MSETLLEIERALDRDDLSAAAALSSKALSEGVQDPLVFNLVAWRHEEDGQLEEAEGVLRQALAAWPRDPSLSLALGLVLRKLGRMREAVQAFEQAIALDPNYTAAWYERGVTFERGGAMADAADDFGRALALEPDNPAVHAALSANLARRGEREQAAVHARRALELTPRNVGALSSLAMIAVEEKRFADAVALLEPAIQDSSTSEEALVGARTLLGDAYEGLGRYDDAYRVYAQAQELFHAMNSNRMGEGVLDALESAKRIGDSLETADPGLWKGSVPAEAPPATHVFLTGYPRSGTTMVENILATLPDAVAIEERRTLGMIDRDFLQDFDGMARFASLSEDKLAGFRANYWQRAIDAARDPLTGKLFIDMDPFKGLRLPVIAKLFPGAKVVIMRRDPRDVVWSCFHTSFAFNPGTMAFVSLESTARHYALTQRIIERSLRTLPIDAFELRYESMVRDFDETSQKLCSFLGVDWDSNLRQFDRTAQRRGVSTASSTQVRKGLYDGSGGWRRYERQLATVEPILRPWIEKLGYA